MSFFSGRTVGLSWYPDAVVTERILLDDHASFAVAFIYIALTVVVDLKA